MCRVVKQGDSGKGRKGEKVSCHGKVWTKSREPRKKGETNNYRDYWKKTLGIKRNKKGPKLREAQPCGKEIPSVRTNWGGRTRKLERNKIGVGGTPATIRQLLESLEGEKIVWLGGKLRRKPGSGGTGGGGD